MKKWEYMTIRELGSSMCADELDHLGIDGWELVSVVVLKDGNRFGDDTSYLFYFKREVS